MPNSWKNFLLIISSASLLALGFASHQARAVSNELFLSLPDGEEITMPEDLIVTIRNNPTDIPQSNLIKSHPDFSSFLAARHGTQGEQTKAGFVRLADFIKKEITTKLDHREPVNAIWEEKDGRVVNFQPHADGLSYDVFQIAYAINKAIKSYQYELEVAIITVKADKQLADLNSYGVNELIATGESNFRGSSGNRMTNIRVGASKYKGALIAPGEEFSFNSYLGPIDAAHGWAPEMVIKKSGVVPEFGGGICQVSTTVFRAALNAGLAITERRNHSFAVSYYAPQGTDATIYTGVIDLKFMNDTKNYIMVWTRIEGTKLYFDFYGKLDGRKVAINDPIRYGFQDNGAFKASLKRIVTLASGEQREDNFTSSYRPREEFIITDTEKDPPKEVTNGTSTSSGPNGNDDNNDNNEENQT